MNVSVQNQFRRKKRKLEEDLQKSFFTPNIVSPFQRGLEKSNDSSAFTDNGVLSKDVALDEVIQ